MPEEIKPEVIQRTQKTLGKYIKKPPLTDKLLKKPPFRFLHDVIKAVITETGFLKGLFSEDELNSEKVKEKDAKIAFLTKLIDAVKIIMKIELAARPSKIVAGLEPTETNVLLQTIGKALEKKVDSTVYINQLHSGQTTIKETKKTTKIPDKDGKLKKTRTSTNKEQKNKNPTNETPKSIERSRTKHSTKETKSKIVSDESKKKRKENENNKTVELNKSETAIINDEGKNVNDKTEVPETNVSNNDSEEPGNKALIEHSSRELVESKTVTEEVSVTNSEQKTELNLDTDQEKDTVKKRPASVSRPKSARPKSGEIKEVKDEKTTAQNRPKSTLRPPSVRPSSARPGAPRLRPDSTFPVKEVIPMGKINVIVESFDKDVDEEETVVIQSNIENNEEHTTEIIADIPPENKGHLVEQILEQIEGDGDKIKDKVEIDWQKDGLNGKDATTKETNNLRTLIQTLTRTVTPLGKLLNYLHEDIDAMHAELEGWTITKRQLFAEIAKQKKISSELNKPLFSQLDNLNQEIKKYEEDIANIRSSILKNDLRIKELLVK